MSSLRVLLPGSVLGRYQLVLKVASGGMGEVWAARQHGSRGFQKVVAIKTLLPELSHNPNFEAAFLDEAALAARIKHPNVVQIVDLGEEEHILYQVMEWVSGASLWTLMRAAARRDGVPLVVAARIVCQVCAGLHAAHELSGDDGTPLHLVHRDVTPQNVLITTDGLSKVVDFGVAKYAGRGVAETKAGELRGKVPYMAPEHILGNPVDRRADVFALGIVLYQLISGVHPFLEDDDRLTMARISSALPATPLKNRVPTIPDGVGDLVAAALSKSPKARTPSAADLMRALERLIPDCALASSNQLVADFSRETVGEQIESRSQSLRDALAQMDDDGRDPLSATTTPPPAAARGAGSQPPRTPVTIPAPPGMAPPPANEPQLQAPGTPRDLRPEPPAGQEPSVSGVSNTLDLSSEDLELPIAGLRSSWLSKRSLIAGGSALVVLAGTAIAISTAGGPSEEPAPAVSVAPAPGPPVGAESPLGVSALPSAPQALPVPEPPPPTPPATASAAPAPTAPAAPVSTHAAAPGPLKPPAASPPQPPVAQPPVAQPPVAQPPVAQPPVAQPPVAAPPTSTRRKEFSPKGL